MAKIIETATGALALTFDDVLLQPGHSEVLPGQTETGPMKEYLASMPDSGEKMLRRLPMGRMATTAEIANAVAWLCSDAASYVNGVSLTVDGGLIAR